MPDSEDSLTPPKAQTSSEHLQMYYLSKVAHELLEEARITTKRQFQGRKYDSSTFQHCIHSELEAIANHPPYEWQVDVMEALFLHLNTVAITGTGSGKTLPFAMIHLVQPHQTNIDHLHTQCS
jgi:ATP-dependent helicase YprA (DUF1998 family)